MRIVVLSASAPEPPWHGGRIRVYNLVKGLAAAGHAVTVLCTDVRSPDEHDLEGVTIEVLAGRPRRTLREKFSTTVSALPEAAWLSMSADDRVKVARALVGADFVLLEQMHMVAYLPIIEQWGGPFILDTHNVEHELLAQMARVAPKLRTRIRMAADAVKMRRYERRLLRRATRVLAVSESDRDALLALGGTAPIDVIANGVDLDYFSFVDHGAARGASLVMTGTMGYLPNVDAALWLIDDLLPRIRTRRPDATLTLVGNEPAAGVLAAAARSEGVLVTGSVPDVRPYVRDADLFVLPFRVGGGTRLKSLEAMASGIPVVSTTVGCMGLAVTSGAELLVADDPVSFADACVALLADEPLRRKLATSARTHVEDAFSWATITRALEESIERAVATHRQG